MVTLLSNSKALQDLGDFINECGYRLTDGPHLGKPAGFFGLMESAEELPRSASSAK